MEFKVCRRRDLLAGTNDELQALTHLLANSATR